METLRGMKRTDMCANFSAKDIGREVTVMGWAGKVRDIGSIVFIDLRDRSGIIQLVCETPEEILEKAKKKNNFGTGLNLVAGFAFAALFLSTIIPKIQYWVTKMKTGQDAFPGLYEFEENKK